MNNKVLQTLEYNKIKNQLNDYIVTDQGKKFVSQLEPQTQPNIINQLLMETFDGANIVRLKGEIPIPKILDINPYLKRLSIEDASLSGTELSQILKVLRAVQAVRKFFDNFEDETVELTQIPTIISTLSYLPDITDQMIRSINEDGSILDTASVELSHIRQQIAKIQNTIRAKMNRYLKGSTASYLSEPLVTIREERFVLPIKAEYKQKFGGIIHDQSASGQTLYIEPNDVVETSNELRREQLKEKYEERKILLDLSNQLRPYIDELKNNVNILGHLDFINAKAKYAHKVKGIMPKVSEANLVSLRQARHPLIDQSKVVANDIILGDEYKTIIITGPNTGGKTITIKTLGILQLLGQSGLFITANENSQIGVFDDIFADIGDDQSIEANLSTFSSHMNNVISILNQATDHSLILLDELGAGTDPKEGAALAMAIIDQIGVIGSELIATTHYPELKAYAYDRYSTINASMEFDIDSLKPTYQLLLGIPGQSNALNIAQKLGMDNNIIDTARSFTDEQNQDINNMIDELVEQNKEARQNAEETKADLEEAQKLFNDLKDKFDKYQLQKEKLFEQARIEANQVISDSKQKADKIIEDLRHKQANLASATVKENELMDAKGALNSLEIAPNLKHNKVLKKEKAKHDFHKNDEVLVKSYGQMGTLVQKIGDSEWEVQLGILKMRIDESDLEKSKAPKEPKKVRTNVSRTKSAGISPTLDLRGERYEEAMYHLDQYVDSSLLAGYPSITIIHGKGTGALRSGVNNYLKKHPRVKSYGYSAPNAGGDGSTVVKFK
ncbi:endonuclease MutS2 [Lentilactobacillus laojiaonis]|uniref:endonuclease MutS2 n=1 Tax=Lentilactobacillus laojiaonis TaxID=2883998 RepID=UPI001D0AD820|nr:endonuclease MutS2 [Lentilactobacillus laojiaonis]UDM31699.1 endonuclease MutS2 [Lentilactobacillus laojiaonis]